MKPMHFAMALLSAAMFFVWRASLWASSWGWTARSWWWIPPRHPLAVGVYRHRCGVPVPAAASAVPEDAEKRLRAEIRPAGDRRYNRETEAVPCGAAGGCRGVAVYGIARDGGYCHLTMIYVILGLGLNVVVGLSGLLVLGYGGFYAIGAYTFALLNHYYGLGFWTCLPLAGWSLPRRASCSASRCCACAVTTAIVTLGFGEIVRILLLNNTEVTGGPNGISQIPKPTFFGTEFSRTAREGGWDTFSNFFGIKYDPSDRVIWLYLVALLLVVITLFVINRLLRMPLGRAWEALREDEIACRSGPEPDPHQADRIYHQRRVCRFRRNAVCRASGLRQPGIVHLCRIGLRAGDCGARRNGLAVRRDPRGYPAGGLPRADARL